MNVGAGRVGEETADRVVLERIQVTAGYIGSLIGGSAQMPHDSGYPVLIIDERRRGAVAVGVGVSFG